MSLVPVSRSRRAGTRSRRLAALAALAAVAFAAGVAVGANDPDAAREAARRFAAAWQRGDYVAMRAELTAPAQRRASMRRFERTYRQAAQALTLTSLRTGAPGEPSDGIVELPVTFTTRLFGTLRGRLALPVAGEREGAGIDWRAQLVFPDLRRGERMSSQTMLPARASLLARDGTPLAEGPARTSPLGAIAAEVAGRLGPAPREEAAELRRRGVPPDALVGLNGLEREFEERLAGRPGGRLRAGRRIVAVVPARQAPDVRTTIDPDVQRAAVAALAGRYGGIAALHPGTGEVLALAGVAFSAPQPPGSVFKIVTLAGALEARIVKRSATFPVETHATLSGVELENANGESCGGSLRSSFAHSCNSVFAPLGARLGARALVQAAERFGFNERPPFEGAAVSAIPQWREIGDDLAVGSTAIGQGRVTATALQMAVVAAAVAERGARVRPTLLRGERRGSVRATTPAVARTLASYMRSVVEFGTGTAAALDGVAVAGKTGTAELRTTVGPDTEPPADAATPPEQDKADTDAWFAAFAPQRRPRIAVAVLLVGQGAGGETAAPAAKTVLAAALGR